MALDRAKPASAWVGRNSPQPPRTLGAPARGGTQLGANLAFVANRLKKVTIMLRFLNFAFVAITCAVCLGLYHVAEDARVSQAELRATRAAIQQENDLMAVLGAEWARLTQPARIQALAVKHLGFSDAPTMQFSSVLALPNRSLPAAQDNPVQSAKIVRAAPSEPAPHIVDPGT